MNETKHKNNHLVITHQPFLLHYFNFFSKHMASDSVSRALIRIKEKFKLSYLPPFLLSCDGFEIPFLRVIRGFLSADYSLEGKYR